MATIRKRGDKWYAETCVDGRRKGKTFSYKAAAKKWAAEQETLRGEETAEGSGRTVADAIERYINTVSSGKKSYYKERGRLQNLLRRDLARLPIQQVQSRHIAEWRDQRLTEVSPSSVAREMTILSHLFATAVREWNWIKSSPVKGVTRPKEPPPRDRRISQEEVDLICTCLGYDQSQPGTDTISKRVAIAFLLAIETGMRQGELVQIKPESVKGRVISLVDTKNGDRREVPLSIRAITLLESVGYDLGLKTTQIDSLFRKAVRRSGIENLRFHDTRHEAVTRLAAKLDVLTLARVIGHRDIRMLQRYYNPTGEEIAERL